ncbi:hypothetical protein BJ742DRAFT_336881 [Cladochytrium replicatum]|nr:hypothetical protein BJ742DRAFT_336881 [Cladochytrium replicatum]
MPLPLPAGVKFFFPNFIFRLVRSNLPPHQAVFQVPLELNKIDIKSFLEQAYKLDITDVRTMIYRPKPHSTRSGVKAQTKSFKKAIVTMKDDFVWPAPPEAGAPGQEPFKIPIRANVGKGTSKRYGHKL